MASGIFVKGRVLKVVERGEMYVAGIFDDESAGSMDVHQVMFSNADDVPGEGQKVCCKVNLSHGNKEYPQATLWFREYINGGADGDK